MADSFEQSKLASGDKPAWDRFVARFAGVVHAAINATLRRAGRDTGDAADLSQDVFARLCRNDFHLIRNYDPLRASVSTWLSLIARSVTLDSLRRHQPSFTALDDAPEAALAVPADEGAQPIQLPAGLLSPRQELILTMLYDRDMDPADVAAELNIDPQTVRSQHHKALTKLRALYGDHPP